MGQQPNKQAKINKPTQNPTPETHEPPVEKVMETPAPFKTKSSGATAKTSPEEELEAFFEKYKDPISNQIMAGGVEKFCIDLKVEPTDFIVLAIAWQFNAEQMCLFTRDQFMSGCTSLNAYNLKDLKKALPNLKTQVGQKANFKKLYYFTYQFGLEQGQRVLPIEMAVPLWQCVFLGAPEQPKLLDEWLGFLQESGAKFISKDTWNMFYHFLDTVKVDFSNYDDTDAWPSLFDDFFEFQKGKNTKTA